MRHLELFAGIGGFRRALDLIQQDLHVPMECVGFSEIDAKAKQTYCANFHIGENEVDMGDIVSFNSVKQNIRNLPDFDLLTGGFPCQTFSMMGKKAGFDEDRGQMFFRIIDILEVKRPRYILLENVKNLVNHDKGNTFVKIKQELESLGYRVFPNIYNTSDYHLPQTRNRLVIFGTRDNLDEAQIQKMFTPIAVKKTFDKVYKKGSPYYYKNIIDILSTQVDSKYFLSERIKPTILADGSSNFKSKSDINMLIARPLTATMHKMHRACQDNYYSQNFIESKGKTNPVENCSKEQLAKMPIRKLTPEEAFMLQGFPKEFAINARETGVSDGALYKQAGNAVSVNTIYAILYFLITNNLIVE